MQPAAQFGHPDLIGGQADQERGCRFARQVPDVGQRPAGVEHAQPRVAGGVHLQHQPVHRLGHLEKPGLPYPGRQRGRVQAGAARQGGAQGAQEAGVSEQMGRGRVVVYFDDASCCRGQVGHHSGYAGKHPSHPAGIQWSFNAEHSVCRMPAGQQSRPVGMRHRGAGG